MVRAAAIALVLLAAAGCRPGGTPQSARYHVLRFWGVKAKPPPEVIDQAIDRAADRHGIPRGLFRALVHVESRKNPDAVSPVGARGLSQVMPFNAKRCGLPSARLLFDPIANARCGAQILAEDLKTYGGDLRKALASYNCGRADCKAGQQYAAKVLGLARRG